MDVSAVVVESPGTAFRKTILELRGPGPDEIRVRLLATGLCHTDFMVQDGHIPVPSPFVPGHEGAGIVEETGPCVTDIRPGQAVVLSFAFCGTCPSCLSGRPSYCHRFFPLNFRPRKMPSPPKFRKKDGSAVFGDFFGQSSLATQTVVHRRNAIPVPEDLPLSFLGPMGCSFMTGAGTIWNVFRPRPGESLVVWGLGPVGLTAVMAGRICGMEPIIGVDIRRNRAELATVLGAHHGISGTMTEMREALQSLIPYGAQWVLDTTGVPEVLETGLKLVRPGGTCATVATAPAAATVSVKLSTILPGRSFRGVVEGDAHPGIFIPKMIRWFRQGRFPVDRLITEFAFQDIEEAVRSARRGEVIKAVVRMSGD